MLENNSYQEYRLLLNLFVFMMLTLNVNAQLSQGGRPLKSPIKSFVPEWIDLEKVNVEELLLEDEWMTGNGHKNQRIAKEIPVSLQPEYAGSWEELLDGTLIWRIGIRGKGARALGIVFDRYVLTEGTRIYIYDPPEVNLLGAFTSLNNKTSGGLAITYLQGDELIIQMEIPPECKNYGKLRIGSVRWAYMPVFDTKSINDGYYGRADTCNIDINCPAGNDWQLLKSSVVRMINDELCTGVLVNNTNKDGKPYIYTAAHCVFDRFTGEYQPTVFYFNYESPFCDGPDGIDNLSISGATLVATGDTSENPRDADSLDFALLELSVMPPDSFITYYAGWNRDKSPAQNTTTIHHPRGDVKKISKDYNPPETSYHDENYLPELVKYSHWRILEWDLATTEWGSSGCPLFDQDQRLVGTLTGGAANCVNSVNDYYTKFDYAWDYYSEPTKQLKHWLDPDNTGVLSLPGFDLSSSGCLLRNIQLKKNNITCIGLSDGSIEVSIFGTGQMDYNWSNGDTSQIISNLSTGWYKVTVTDTIGCSLSDSVEIIEPDSLIITFIDSVYPTYYGFDDGSATVNVEGGTPSYNYLWDDRSSSKTATSENLGANKYYHVTVTDNNLCLAVDSIILDESSKLFTSMTVIKNISCHGYSDGSAVLTVKYGEPPFTYTWDHDSLLNDSVAHSLQAGINYQVTVTDSLGNIGSNYIHLTQPPPENYNLDFSVDKQLLTAPPFAFQFTNNTPNIDDYTFIWDFGDDTTIINNNPTVFHEYLYNGTYDVILIAQHNGTGCFDSLLYKEFIYCTGGTDPTYIKSLDETEQLIIYPNPSSVTTTIEFPNPEHAAYKLILTDLTGKIIKRMDNITEDKIELRTISLSDGIYLIELRGPKIYQGKLVLE
jgi:hypothetical protein